MTYVTPDLVRALTDDHLAKAQDYRTTKQAAAVRPAGGTKSVPRLVAALRHLLLNTTK